MFSAGFDKLLCKFENYKEISKLTLPNKVQTMHATETHIYILTWSSELLIVDVRDMTIKTNKKLNYEGTAMALCND